MPHLFCFGFGFSARTLSTRLLAEGWEVTGTCRTPAKIPAITATGAKAVKFDGTGPSEDVVAALLTATHVLVSAPPASDGDPVLICHGDDIAALGSQVEWIGYLSTTGVYGDRGGEWVDEDSALAPTTNRGRARLESEWEWQEHAEKTGQPTHIFRLAGIYGPGRNQLEAVRKGTARRVVKEGQVFSRIHVGDIATILEASIAKPNSGRIYNVCDDEAAPPQDVVAHAALLLGRPVPEETPYEEAELTDMGRSFFAESKRVSNARIKEELGVKFAYPTYKEGLKALLADG